MLKRLIEEIKARLKGMRSIELGLHHFEKIELERLGLCIYKTLRFELGEGFAKSLLKPYLTGKSLRAGLLNIGIVSSLYEKTDHLSSKDTELAALAKANIDEGFAGKEEVRSLLQEIEDAK